MMKIKEIKHLNKRDTIVFTTVIFLLFAKIILGANSLFGQKILLDYRITYHNEDSLDFKFKPLSDKTIENKIINKNLKEFPNSSQLITLSDNLGRRFESIDINDSIQILRALNKGHNNLYMKSIGRISEYYILITPTDTIEIKKNDRIENSYLHKDNKYLGQLHYLARDFPDISKTADNVSFKSKSIQSFINNLNEQYPDEKNEQYASISTLSYLQMGVKAFYSENRKIYSINVLSSHYILNLTTNLSFRVGLSANYHQQINNYPEKWFIYQNTFVDMLGPNTYSDTILIHPAYQQTNTRKFVEIPLILNWEFTNWYITPYFYYGLAPTVCNENVIIRINQTNFYHSGWRFRPNTIMGIGVKTKLSNKINLMTELRTDHEAISDGYFLFGAEYIISTKHLKAIH